MKSFFKLLVWLILIWLVLSLGIAFIPTMMS